MEKNYCKTTGMISSCTAEDTTNQENCTFYERSSFKNKCMYFIFDEYCDCLKAQMDARGEKEFSKGELNKMELKDGRITMLASEKGMTIELRDFKASTTFAEIKLDSIQLAQTLGRFGHTKCKINLHGLDKVGKKMEHKTFEFKIPDDLGWGADTENIVIQTAKDKCPKSWIPDLSFSSYDSFFIKDEQRYAKTTIRRWVDIS